MRALRDWISYFVRSPHALWSTAPNYTQPSWNTSDHGRRIEKALLTGRADYLLDEILLGAEAQHVAAQDITFIQQLLAHTFTPVRKVDLWIVGSAKLGFSTTEKYLKHNGTLLRRYRTFSEHSDIDVAVVSQDIFTPVWDDLSRYAHRAQRSLGFREARRLSCLWLAEDLTAFLRVCGCATVINGGIHSDKYQLTIDLDEERCEAVSLPLLNTFVDIWSGR